MRPAPAFVLMAILASSSWAQQERPSIGMWVTGPVGNAHDLVPDAVTISQFAAGNRLIGNATTFLACKGNTGGPPSLELRFLPNPFQGYVQGTQAATMSFDGDNHPVSLETFPVQNKPLFIVQPGPAETQKIAGVPENRSTTLSVRFKVTGGQEMSFILTLRPPTGQVAAVLAACHVNVPAAPRSGTPVSAVTVPAGPPHPASTVVDLPPAAPGYPPLHASRPADDGCWWTPFASQKFGLEMAVEKCAKPKVDTLFAENATGITEQYQKAPLPPPDVIFTVHTKPAEQSIEAAIKQQFIAKLDRPGRPDKLPGETANGRIGEVGHVHGERHRPVRQSQEISL